MFGINHLKQGRSISGYMQTLTLASSIVALLFLGACSSSDNGDGNADPDPDPSGSVNTAPTANAGSDQNVQEGMTVQLSGSGSDAEGTIIYQWLQISGPSVTLANSSNATSTFAAPAVAEDTLLTFQLTVTDEGGLTATGSTNINVSNSGAPPVISFNRRIKTLRYDFDNNGIDEGVRTYFYNSDGSIDSTIYTYTDDGVTDTDFGSFLISPGTANEDVTENFTYDANGNVATWTFLMADSSTEIAYEWGADGTISTATFDQVDMGALQGRLVFTLTYAQGLLSSVQGGVTFPASSDTSLNLDFRYNVAGELLSDRLTTTSGNIVIQQQRDYSWNNDGAIENILNFNPDPNVDFQTNESYVYTAGRLSEFVNNSSAGELYAWNYAYSANELLESFVIDLENDDVFEAKVQIEWESQVCIEAIVWALNGGPDTSKRLSDPLPYTLGDGHFVIPNCGSVAL